MNNRQQAIRDALDGGWDDTDYAFGADTKDTDWEVRGWQYDKKVFIDPRFWRACGKTRGWHKQPKGASMTPHWQYVASTFFWNVMDGLSIEEALGKL